MSNVGSLLISSFLVQSPLLALYVIGILISMARWNRYPRVCAMTFFGLGVTLLTTVATCGLYAWLPTYRASSGMPISSSTRIYLIVNVVGALVRAGGLALVLGAVFSGRNGYQQGFPMESRPSQAAGGPGYGSWSPPGQV